MNKTANWTNYEKRLWRVITYIHDHLDEELDLNKLADIACMSPYHWHRIYNAIYGESIVATVKRVRLHHAAGYLATTSKSIEEIAAKCGYKNVQSFTRIFKSEYGLPPAQYRQNGSHTHFKLQNMQEDKSMYDIEIKNMPHMKTAAVSHLGSYMQISKAFETLYAWFATRDLMRPELRSLGIYYDDPATVEEAKLRAHAAIVVDPNFDTQPPLESIDIAAGSYAVLRYKGPYADMHAAYKWFYGEWLVNSNNELADAPAYEEYLNNPRDTAPSELCTNIYLPLR